MNIFRKIRCFIRAQYPNHWLAIWVSFLVASVLVAVQTLLFVLCCFDVVTWEYLWDPLCYGGVLGAIGWLALGAHDLRVNEKDEG
jgi:hypothetical protein